MWTCKRCDVTFVFESIEQHVYRNHMKPFGTGRRWTVYDCGGCSFMGEGFEDMARHCLDFRHKPTGVLKGQDYDSYVSQLFSMMEDVFLTDIPVVENRSRLTQNGRTRSQQRSLTASAVVQQKNILRSGKNNAGGHQHKRIVSDLIRKRKRIEYLTTKRRKGVVVSYKGGMQKRKPSPPSVSAGLKHDDGQKKSSNPAQIPRRPMITEKPSKNRPAQKRPNSISILPSKSTVQASTVLTKASTASNNRKQGPQLFDLAIGDEKQSMSNPSSQSTPKRKRNNGSSSSVFDPIVDVINWSIQTHNNLGIDHLTPTANDFSIAIAKEEPKSEEPDEQQNSMKDTALGGKKEELSMRKTSQVECATKSRIIRQEIEPEDSNEQTCGSIRLRDPTSVFSNETSSETSSSLDHQTNQLGESNHQEVDPSDDIETVAVTKPSKTARPRRFPCSYCPKLFSYAYVAKIHERLHTGERPFTCPVCGKTFYESGGFRRHQKTFGHFLTLSDSVGSKTLESDAVKTEETLPVTDNGSATVVKSSHGDVFSGDDRGGDSVPGDNHPGAISSDRSPVDHQAVTAFTVDQDATEKEKVEEKKAAYDARFSCDKCGKRFAYEWNVRRHQITHTGKRPFTCTESGCDRAFSWSSNLRRHQLSVHGGRKKESDENEAEADEAVVLEEKQTADLTVEEERVTI